jgi:hypothetical protein
MLSTRLAFVLLYRSTSLISAKSFSQCRRRNSMLIVFHDEPPKMPDAANKFPNYLQEMYSLLPELIDRSPPVEYSHKDD